MIGRKSRKKGNRYLHSASDDPLFASLSIRISQKRSLTRRKIKLQIVGEWVRYLCPSAARPMASITALKHRVSPSVWVTSLIFLAVWITFVACCNMYCNIYDRSNFSIAILENETNCVESLLAKPPCYHEDPTQNQIVSVLGKYKSIHWRCEKKDWT